MFRTTVTVPKSLNSVWAGTGKLVRVDIDIHHVGDVAVVLMETGRMRGNEGGFPLDHLKFKTERERLIAKEPEALNHD